MSHFVDVARLDAGRLAEAWRAARPFPHVVIDDFLAPARLQELREAVAAEPHHLDTADFYEMMASGLPVVHPTLAAFERELGDGATRDAIAAITGKAVTSVEMRSYVYLAGSFLLPHSDYRATFRRTISYAYYLVGDDSCQGGELELFDCVFDGRDLTSTEPALLLAPRVNRLVVFDVSPVSLHQVREVTGGGRVSLAGWYHS